MAKRIVFSILSLGIFILLPIVVQALEPPHDASNAVECLDCHSFALQGGILRITIPRGEEQETVCKNCHNPYGQAASMSNVGNHLVNGGNTIIDCGSCHNPHGPETTTDPHNGVEAPNLKLVRAKVKHVDTALDLAIFQQKPQHLAFDENNSPWNGICQTCHTQTSHHTNDASGDHQHQIGDDCTLCHSHGAGFMPSGGGDCTGCHSNPQDNGDGVPAAGRRTVVTEFPTGSAGLHAHYGAALDPDSCLVCHSVDTHMDGYVELIDPDDGSIYRFIKPGDLTADPDLSDFCANCHDDDGAQRLAAPLDPFGNGNAPPDVATRFLGTLQWDEWYGDYCFGSEGTLRQVNSHHDISDSDQAWSGAKVECLNCHGAHNASADTPIADPSNQTQTWLGGVNDFCLSCHFGGNGPLDPGFPLEVLGLTVVGPTVAMRGLDTCNYNMAPWWVDYKWTHSAHGPDSKRGWGGYSGAPAYELDCTVCHDPHGSYTASNTSGNPYMIRDFVDGTQFVDDATRLGGFNGPPWNTYGAARDVVIPINGIEIGWGSSQGLCNVCHASWVGADWWHDFCNGCQTCHGHGQSWGGADWGSAPDDSSSCASGTASSSLSQPSQTPPDQIHLENADQSCFECHEPHK